MNARSQVAAKKSAKSRGKPANAAVAAKARATESKAKSATKTSSRGEQGESVIPVAKQLESALDALKRASSPRDRDNLARFGIVAKKHFGVSVANVQKIAKGFGKSQPLALLLWKSGWYEARLLASFVAEPERVTPALMDAWCRDFDNWAVCDTVCFHLFDRTPHAFAKVAAWHDRAPEFEKRAAFALLASLAGHDKAAPDQAFLETLPFVEKAAADERNFVKKGVNWALRRIGWRNQHLNRAAADLARRLAESKSAAPRWIGKDALRELTSEKVRKRLKA